MVAIIGLLASVAIGAYQGELSNARATKMAKHYSDSKRLVETMFIDSQSALSNGVPAAFPASVNEWINEINPHDATAPSGGAAFVAGTGDPLTGAVGVQYTGSFAAGDAQVVLHRPAYSGIAATSTTITL